MVFVVLDNAADLVYDYPITMTQHMARGNLEDDWRPLVLSMGDRKSQNSSGVVGGGDGGGGEGGGGGRDGW